MASQVESIKRIPGTPFMVDGFRFANPAREPHVRHFLTHFHGDHYTGLPRTFPSTIFCSDITADLLIHDYRLKVAGPGACQLVRLPMCERLVVDGVGVTALPANHCPGAVMLLFEVPRRGAAAAGGGGGGVHVILHTGDCRWQDWMRDTTPLARVQVQTLYLDATYCRPAHSFPSQEDAIACMIKVCREALAQEPSTLFVSSAYHIGKERGYFSTAEALGLKVWCSAAKMRTLRLLQLPASWMALLTSDPLEAGLHVLGGGLRPERLLRRYGLVVPEGEEQQQQQQQRGRRQPSGGASAARAAGALEGQEDEDEEEDDEQRARREDGAAADEAEEEDLDEALTRKLQGHWKAVVGFRPTGWSYRRSGGLSCWRLGPAAVYGIPYSEHSSFTDLQACVRALRPSRIIPTVNAPDAARARAIVDRFAPLMDLSRDRSRLDAYFLRAAAPAATVAGAAIAAGAAAGGVATCGGAAGGAAAEGAAAGAAAEAGMVPEPAQCGAGISVPSGRGGMGGAVEEPADAGDPCAVGALNCASGARDCAGLQPSSAGPDVGGGASCGGGDGCGSGGGLGKGQDCAVSLEEEDEEQQRRLLEGFERQQALRRSLAAREAARAAKRQCRSSAGSSGAAVAASAGAMRNVDDTSAGIKAGRRNSNSRNSSSSSKTATGKGFRGISSFFTSN